MNRNRMHYTDGQIAVFQNISNCKTRKVNTTEILKYNILASITHFNV